MNRAAALAVRDPRAYKRKSQRAEKEVNWCSHMTLQLIVYVLRYVLSCRVEAASRQPFRNRYFATRYWCCCLTACRFVTRAETCAKSCRTTSLL